MRLAGPRLGTLEAQFTFDEGVYRALSDLVREHGRSLSPDKRQAILRRAHREARNNTTIRREQRKAAAIREQDKCAKRMVAWQLKPQYFFFGWTLYWLAQELRLERWARKVHEVDDTVYLATLIATGLVGSRKEPRSLLHRLKANLKADVPTARNAYWLAAAMLGTLMGMSREKSSKFLREVLELRHSEFRDLADRITGESYGKSLHLFRAEFAGRLGWSLPVARAGQLIEFAELSVFSGSSDRAKHFWRQITPSVSPPFSEGSECARFPFGGKSTAPRPAGLKQAPTVHEALFHGLICDDCLLRQCKQKHSWKGATRLPKESDSEHLQNPQLENAEAFAQEVKSLCEGDELRSMTVQGRLFIALDHGQRVEFDPKATYRPTQCVELFINDGSILWHEVTLPASLLYPLRSRYTVGNRQFTFLQNRNGVTIQHSIQHAGRRFLTWAKFALAPLLAAGGLVVAVGFSSATPNPIRGNIAQSTVSGTLGITAQEAVEVYTGDAPRGWGLSHYELELIDVDGTKGTCSFVSAKQSDQYWDWRFDCSKALPELTPGDIDAMIVEYRLQFFRTVSIKLAPAFRK